MIDGQWCQRYNTIAAKDIKSVQKKDVGKKRWPIQLLCYGEGKKRKREEKGAKKRRKKPILGGRVGDPPICPIQSGPPDVESKPYRYIATENNYQVMLL